MSWALLPLAAALEIAGCLAAWAVWRQGASALWLVPGALALGGFAWLLALVPSLSAGRAFAAYGGVYVVAALLWAVAAEGERPAPLDGLAALMLLGGAALLLRG
ncbi:hypothetical protein ACI6QG_00945 [Roseococcus sp. DSY-14]|uniref:hypothetical protein n=1 Tax=Roseococcus sp. DSY-14 TaxID=3369650 RepID=UPI00387AC850